MIVEFMEPTSDFELTYFASHVHQLNHIWWHDPTGVRLVRSHPEMLALAMSELAEALEGYRKTLMDDHLPQYPMLIVELADTAIRLLDYAGSMSLRLYWPQYHNWPSDITIPEHLWIFMRCVADIPEKRLDDLGPHIGGLITHMAAVAEQLEPSIKFWSVVHSKLIYNQTRVDHTYAARAAEGGKKC